MKILITGATGFIGGRCAAALLEKGHTLTALVRKTSDARFLKSAGAKLICADITCWEQLKGLTNRKFDAVVHCAGLVDNKNFKKLRRVNVSGTENICRLALKLGVTKFIYLSSVSVVSGNNGLLLSEDMPYKASNIYGMSKMEAEKKALEFRAMGLKTVILRPCMVYGEKEPHLMDLMLLLLKRRIMPLVAGGKAKWHLVYIGNLAAAVTMALEQDSLDGGIYFVADSEVLTVKDIFRIFCSELNSKTPMPFPEWAAKLFSKLPVVGGGFGFFLKDRVYDTKKLRSAGYIAPFKAEEALRRTARAWLETRR